MIREKRIVRGRRGQSDPYKESGIYLSKEEIDNMQKRTQLAFAEKEVAQW